MKTAMQELIEWMKEGSGNGTKTIGNILNKSNELLEKEKLQIEEAFRKGGDFRSFGGNPDYYNETYKQ